jgi:hypothetical protein
LIDGRGRWVDMERESRDEKETPRIDVKALPDSVAQLWETMLRLDPNWDLSSWLNKRALEELELVESHLGRERLRLEQRLHRIETLVKRLKRQREVTEGISYIPIKEIYLMFMEILTLLKDKKKFSNKKILRQ